MVEKIRRKDHHGKQEITPTPVARGAKGCI